MLKFSVGEPFGSFLVDTIFDQFRCSVPFSKGPRMVEVPDTAGEGGPDTVSISESAIYSLASTNTSPESLDTSLRVRTPAETGTV